MRLAGTRQYLVAGCAELRILDVTTVDRARLVGLLPVDLATRIADVDDRFVYLVGPNGNVADPDVGLKVVEPNPWGRPQR